MSEQLLLPKNLKYGSKRESAPCTSTRVNIAPQNGTDNYGLGATIIINIPTRRNLCLVSSESYLKFTHTVTNTNAQTTGYRWDSCGAHGLIQRIRVFHGANLLQDIDNYSVLAKMLFDIQVNTSTTYGKLNITTGTRSDLVANLPSSVYVQNDVVPVNQINSGAYIGSVTTGPSTTTTYCLNLISIVGSLCQTNYLPLFAIDTSPLRVEITLQDSLNKIYGGYVSAGFLTGTINLSSVEYIANFLELSDQAMSMVYESLQGNPLQFVVPDYRNFQFTSPLQTGQQINIPIPAKFSSIKSLFITSRDRYITDSYYPLSSCALGISSYYFRIGPKIMPPKAPASIPEMFCEVMKGIDSLSNLYHSPSIDLNSYQLASSAVLTANSVLIGSTSSGSFYIGLDLENYANAPKDVIFAGYNTLTDDIYATITYGTVPGSPLNSVRFDMFAMFDTVLVFENGTAFARY